MDLSGFLMILNQILIFSVLAIFIGRIAGSPWRGRGLLAASILSVYWLQQASPLRYFDFWLPTISLALTVLAWIVSRAGNRRNAQSDLISLAWIFAIILAVAGTRYLPDGWQLTTTRPPSIQNVILLLAALGMVISFVYSAFRGSLWPLVLLIIILFVTLKTEPIILYASKLVRTFSGQSSELASRLDFQWLGFSYIAFRLLHTLRDRATGRLPSLSLHEYVTYVLFFPALSAGPIDRAERFVLDMRSQSRITAKDVFDGGVRISVGVFKKFVLADGLVLIALNGTNATQVESSLWLWIMLYAFTLQIYLDFSGYTDVAIGIGRLAGISLPENFDRPYIQSNLAAFWNRWHITLARWFRFYFFNPLTRNLRRRAKLPVWAIIFIGQIGTMALIGIWHGITWNYLFWGIWHGAGLFIHNRWVALLRTRQKGFLWSFNNSRVVSAAGTLATFHFVALGWVWFALPNLDVSWSILMRLVGN